MFKNMEKTDEAGVQGKSGGKRPERQEVHDREKKVSNEVHFMQTSFHCLSLSSQI